ncbi:MAG: hypothetical protein RXN31_00565 [Candidatus Nanopusillus acidilobi]
MIVKNIRKISKIDQISKAEIDKIRKIKEVKETASLIIFESVKEKLFLTYNRDLYFL